MQGEFGLSFPQGPCIMCSATKAYPNGSIVGSGISALIKESTNAGVGCEVSIETQSMIWAWGSPRFWNSTVFNTMQGVRKISQYRSKELLFNDDKSVER